MCWEGHFNGIMTLFSDKHSFSLNKVFYAIGNRYLCTYCTGRISTWTFSLNNCQLLCLAIMSCYYVLLLCLAIMFCYYVLLFSRLRWRQFQLWRLWRIRSDVEKYGWLKMLYYLHMNFKQIIINKIKQK